MLVFISIASLNYLAAPMHIFNKITLTQFKNYSSATFNFSQKIIGICGLNGKGKTNLLDAIYYCCFTKSYFTAFDALNVQFNTDGFRIEAETQSVFLPDDNAFEKEKKADTQNKIVCIFKGVGKKNFLYNGVAYSKFSEHIGKYPAVMITPDDIELITGGSEMRRRFLDTLISQIDAPYLLQLIQYNKILQQRNSALKQFAEEGKTDEQLLEVLDEQLIKFGNYIYKMRKKFSENLIPLVQKFYFQIAHNEEVVNLQYQSHLNDNTFQSILNQYRQKDFLLQRTHAGLHKDDIALQLNGQIFKNTASQGQRKSLLFALKMAEFELLKKYKTFAPILFLDDVFEKLDEERMHNLLNWVCIKNKGQVFITDTHKQRLNNTFANLNVPYQIIEL